MASDEHKTPINQYVDARELLPDYERRLCPDCGSVQWTKPTNYDHSDHGPVCENCHSYIRETLEVPCPECDNRMRAPGHEDIWDCAVCDKTFDRPKETLIDRLSGRSHVARGMPGACFNGECPVCGENDVKGDPDGDLYCDHCRNFHAGQYSAKWYAYAHWMKGERDVRVNTEGAV